MGDGIEFPNCFRAFELSVNLIKALMCFDVFLRINLKATGTLIRLQKLCI